MNSVVLHKPRHKVIQGDPMIIESYHIGKVQIHIASDYMATTPEAVEQVLVANAEANWAIWDSLTREEQIAWNEG